MLNQEGRGASQEVTFLKKVGLTALLKYTLPAITHLKWTFWWVWEVQYSFVNITPSAVREHFHHHPTAPPSQETTFELGSEDSDWDKFGGERIIPGWRNRDSRNAAGQGWACCVHRRKGCPQNRRGWDVASGSGSEIGLRCTRVLWTSWRFPMPCITCGPHRPTNTWKTPANSLSSSQMAEMFSPNLIAEEREGTEEFSGTGHASSLGFHDSVNWMLVTFFLWMRKSRLNNLTKAT